MSSKAKARAPSASAVPVDAIATARPPTIARPLGVVILAALWGWLLALFLWSRFLHIEQSLWWDEVYSVVTYVKPGLTAPWRGYTPNDHLLYEQVAYVASQVLGSSEIVYRLPAVAGCLAAITLLAWFLWTRFGLLASAAFAVLAVTSPVTLILSRQARGYGIGFLAAAVLIWAGDAVIRTGQRKYLVCFGLGGFVGIATLPIFAVPFVVASAALMLERRIRAGVGLMVGAVGLVSFLYLQPVLAAIRFHAGQDFGDLLPDDGVLKSWADDLLAPTWRLLVPGADGSGRAHAIGYVVSYTAIGLGLRRLWRRNDRTLALLLAGPILSTYLLITLLGLHVVPRFTSYLISAALVLVALGCAELVDVVTHGVPWRRVAVVTFLALGASLMMARFVDFAQATAATPYENYKEVSTVANAAPGTEVLNNYSAGGFIGLRYYLTKDLVILDINQLRDRFCHAAPPIVYIEYYFAPTADTTCLKARGASLHHEAQNRAPIPLPGVPLGQWMDVWVLAP